MGVIRIFRRRAVRTAWLAVTILALLGGTQALASAGIPAFQGFYEYTIAFNGDGSYSRTQSSEGGSTLKEEASWSWNSVYPHILIPTTASSPLALASFPAYGLGQAGSGKWTITNTGSQGEDCSNRGTLGLHSEPAEAAAAASRSIARASGSARGCSSI